MASGDLTSSAGIYVSSKEDMKIAIDSLNLAAVTDTIHIVPATGRDKSWIVFKVEREA